MEAYLRSLIKGFQEQGDRVSVYACKVDWDLVAEMGCRVQQVRSLLPRKMREYQFLHRCDSLPLRTDYDLSLGLCRTSSPRVNVCGGVHVETIRHVRRTALLRAVYDLFESISKRKCF
jgi:hypothetical protein